MERPVPTLVTSSVIVLSHQPGDWLAECLASVSEQADEVVLVDNGSLDAEASDVGRRAGARIIRVGANLGYAGGVNLGVRHARGELIALLNDDAVAGPGWIATATEALSDASVAAVAPKVRRAGWYREVVLDDERVVAAADHRILGRQLRSAEASGRDVLDGLLGVGIHQLEVEPGRAEHRWRWTVPGQPFYVPISDPRSGGDVRVNGEPAPPGPVCRLLNKAGSYMRADGIFGDYGDECPDDGRWDQEAERFFASGTALVTRASTWQRVGELPEPFFAYCEDADWSWRARLLGLRILYDPGAVVDHRVSATSGGSAVARVRQLAGCNRVLCQVRSAPVEVAAHSIRRLVQDGPAEGARRRFLRHLSWALGSRLRLSRRWQQSPAEVWRQWAGVDIRWDTGPSRVDASGAGLGRSASRHDAPGPSRQPPNES